MPELTFSASFRIHGATLDPARVSSRLGLEADDAHRAGDPNFGKSGRRHADFAAGLWSLKSTLDERQPPDAHAAFLLSRLEGRGAALRRLRRAGFRLDLFLGVFGAGTGNYGFSLASETMKALGEFGIQLEVDGYD